LKLATDSAVKKVLVIGADSTLAQAYMAGVDKRLVEITTTTRKPDVCASNTTAHSVFLDLDDPDLTPLMEREFDFAVVFAAMTNMSACEQKPELAMQVNCDSVQGLLRGLRVKKWVLLSTNMVFSGAFPHVTHKHETCPFNHYGKTKAFMEEKALGYFPNVAVVRLTKVIGKDYQLFEAKLAELKQGRSAEVFQDMHLCPISQSSVCRYLQALILDFKPGIHQLSGKEDVSYLQLFEFLCQRLKIDKANLKGVPAKVSAPKFTSLLVDTREAEYGFYRQSLADGLADFIEEQSLYVYDSKQTL
jgi:dTDP-4-dehydrorhamnose reductase